MFTPRRIVLVVCLMAAAFTAGWIASRPSGPSASVRAADPSGKTQRWECPMHPQYTSDRQGDCPICGMRLTPVHADSRPGQAAAPLPVGEVEVAAARQQLIGVRTDEVTRAPVSQSIRLSGRVAVDEARLHRLIAAVDGWIRELGPNSAGAFVKQNQKLASYYAPSLLPAQQAFMFATSAADPFTRAELAGGSQRPPTSLNVQSAVDGLRGLGMSDLQMEEVKKSRVYATQINVYSPITGYVIARDISPGQRFEKGAELFRIADISHLWVITDVFEKDRVFVRPGATAKVRYAGREFLARMSDALPQFDPQSRTLKTRFELDNVGNVLRPDMFVDVELPVSLPAAITVPADAVIDSGLKKTVYVAKGDGYFEPRSVETGWRLGDQVEIVKGLMPGEHIVVSGNFLLDSESRMRMTVGQGAQAPADSPAAAKAQIDPVCGMEVDPAKAAGKSQYKGKTYYFCSEGCKKKFDGNPVAFLGKKKD